MDDAAFEVREHRERDLLVIRLRGLWNRGDVDHFIASLDAVASARARAGLQPGCPKVLIDTTSHDVQTKQVAALLQDRFTSHANAGRRIAMLIDGRQLQRLQIRRVAAAAQHEFFLDEEDAIRWLEASTIVGATARREVGLKVVAPACP